MYHYTEISGMKTTINSHKRKTLWNSIRIACLASVLVGFSFSGSGCKHVRNESRQLGWTMRTLFDQSKWWDSLKSDVSILMDPELDAMGETIDLFLQSSDAQF